MTGAGLAVLTGGLQSHRPDLVDGVGLIVGIDRFMSEARAVTNFSGNAVATAQICSQPRTEADYYAFQVTSVPSSETRMPSESP